MLGYLLLLHGDQHAHLTLLRGRQERPAYNSVGECLKLCGTVVAMYVLAVYPLAVEASNCNILLSILLSSLLYIDIKSQVITYP